MQPATLCGAWKSNFTRPVCGPFTLWLKTGQSLRVRNFKPSSGVFLILINFRRFGLNLVTKQETPKSFRKVNFSQDRTGGGGGWGLSYVGGLVAPCKLILGEVAFFGK